MAGRIVHYKQWDNKPHPINTISDFEIRILRAYWLLVARFSEKAAIIFRQRVTSNLQRNIPKSEIRNPNWNQCPPPFLKMSPTRIPAPMAISAAIIP